MRVGARRVAGGVGAGAAAAALWHIGPAATWLPWVRRRLPPLAAAGRPDHVALTFDDGPVAASTPAVLAVLAAAGVRATFFVLGGLLARDHGLGRELCAAGHELAVHGWDHRWLPGRRYRAVRDDLARTRDVVWEVAGEPPLWFRPAYGVLTGDAALAARRLGLRPVLWTVWGRDWTATATADSVMRTVAPGLRGGATVLLHDAGPADAPGTWRATVGALPRIVQLAGARGLALGPLREHEVARSGAACRGGHSGRDAVLATGRVGVRSAG